MKCWLSCLGFIFGFVLSAATVAASSSTMPNPSNATISCAWQRGVQDVVKASFEYRAARAVHHLDEYITHLSSYTVISKNTSSEEEKVCRLYALDELADIYTTQLVQFDLADRINAEAKALFREMNCCKASYNFSGTFYPPNRLIFSFMYGPKRKILTEYSPYPNRYRMQVAESDLENVRHRIEQRQLLLDATLKRPSPAPSERRPDAHLKEITGIATKELEFWRMTVQLDPTLSESAQAILLHNRIWSLRGDMDDAAWRTLVIESGKAALTGPQASDTTSPQMAALLQYHLGYAYMRDGQVKEGARTYDEMFQKLGLYQKELGDNFSKVEWARNKEKAFSAAKVALSAGLTGLSWGIQVAGSIGSAIPIIGFAGPSSIILSSGIDMVTSMASATVNAINPGVEQGLQAYQHARLKLLETEKLFGDIPRALPLILNEHERLELYWDVGRAYEQQGRVQPAIDAYKNAIELIEHERAGLGSEGTRLTFLEGKEDVYGRVIRLLVQAGKPAEAFDYAERARSRNFVDMLASSTPKFRTTKEAEIFAQRLKEQREAEVAAQYSGLTRTEIMQLRGIKVASGTAVADDQSQKNLVPSQTVEFDSLTAVNTATITEIDKQIGHKAAMLSFYVGETHTVVFLLQEGTVSAWVRPVGRAALHGQVEAFRRRIQRNPQDLGLELMTAQKAGEEIHRTILQEALSALRKPVLYISPHGPLHYLPFAAVYDGSQYLTDRVTLITVPSGTVLTYLGKKSRISPGTTVVLANPDLGSSDYDLPFAEREGVAVKNRRPGAMLLKRKEAQEVKIRELGPQASVVHFATHGKFDATKPLESALLLAPGGGEDGTLTAGEIFGLGLPGNLVVLSACETGLGQVATGDEILGLTRAFMYAGAMQLVATLWEIDDQASSELMDHFYANLSKEAAPTALRTAQLKVRARYPHPFYWAGFVAHGMYE